MNPNIYTMQNYILKSMGKTMDVMASRTLEPAKKNMKTCIMHTTSKHCQMIR